MLISFNLRAAVTGWAPIVEAISADIPLSTTTIGILGMFPPLAFALAGLSTSWLSDRVSLTQSLTASGVMMVGGHALRALAPNLDVFIVGSVIGLVGAGFGNVLLPAAVKRFAPHAIGGMTAAYVTTLSVATALPALLAAPVSELYGWRWSFGVWACTALVAVVPWVTLMVIAKGQSSEGTQRADDLAVEAAGASRGLGLARIASSPTARALTVVFIASSIPIYGLFALLPIALNELAGTTAEVSGALVALLAILSLPQALAIPALAVRLRTPTTLMIASVAIFSIGALGLLLSPRTGLVVWVIAMGAGQFLFPLTLTLISLRTLSSHMATRVSGFVQGVGYGIAGFGPPLLAALREWTGSWTPVILAMIASSMLSLTAIPVLRRGGIIDREITPTGQTADPD